MKVASSFKTNRLLLNLAALVVLLPAFVPYVGIAALTGSPSLLGILIICVPVIAAIVILWRGAVGVSLALLATALLALTFTSGGTPMGTPPDRTLLVLGSRSRFTGVDVYCNDVHLGKTPIRISREEFRKRVKPWDTPPRQDRLGNVWDAPGDRFTSVRYTWVPRDIFEEYEVWPPNHMRYSVHQDKEINEALRTSRYWWRFEKGGHGGLTRMGGGGGSSGGQGVRTIRNSPDTEYPSAKPHARLLAEVLRYQDYRPTKEWIDHFRKHQDLVFLEFVELTREDPRLSPALNVVVRAEFDLPEEPTLEDCDRVLGVIMDRVEARGALQVPSMGTVALELMGETVSPALVKRFKSEMHVKSGGYGRQSSGNWEVRFKSGKAARQLPLAYLIERLAPAGLFDVLAYEFGRTGGSIELVAAYGDEQSAKLLAHHFRGLERKGRRREIESLLRKLSRTRASGAEDDVRRFITNHAFGSQGRHAVRNFVRFRIGTEGIDQEELVQWVFHRAPLEDRDKFDLIRRIDSATTYHYMKMFAVHTDRSKREELVSLLDREPNPSLDQFIIDAYEWYRGPQSRNSWLANLTNALVKTDTPAIRAFITRRLERRDDESRDMLRNIARAKPDLSRLAWMAPLITGIEDAPTRKVAAGVLARIDSDEARTLLDRWVDDSDEGVRQAARSALEIHKKREEESQTRLRQYADLLAGKIKPDDLLAPATPWVWNGETYVSDTE